jgi:hypothetical protein
MKLKSLLETKKSSINEQAMTMEIALNGLIRITEQAKTLYEQAFSQMQNISGDETGDAKQGLKQNVDAMIDSLYTYLKNTKSVTTQLSPDDAVIETALSDLYTDLRNKLYY